MPLEPSSVAADLGEIRHQGGDSGEIGVGPLDDVAIRQLLHLRHGGRTGGGGEDGLRRERDGRLRLGRIRSSGRIRSLRRVRNGAAGRDGFQRGLPDGLGGSGAEAGRTASISSSRMTGRGRGRDRRLVSREEPGRQGAAERLKPSAIDAMVAGATAALGDRNRSSARPERRPQTCPRRRGRGRS